MKYTLLVVLFIIPATVGLAQTPITEHTLRLDDTANSPAATIEDIAWLAGHWKGNGFGGWIEEIWSEPTDRSMMGMFRAVRADTVWFYEFASIAEEGNSLLFRLKHFHPDLKGWESRDETVDFPLVKVEKDTAWFHGLTFQKKAEDRMVIYVELGRNGVVREEVFNMERVDRPMHE